MRDPDDQLHERDIADRDALLPIADMAIELAKEEYQTQRKELMEIAEETIALANETLELIKEENQRLRALLENDPPVFQTGTWQRPGVRWAWGRRP